MTTVEVRWDERGVRGFTVSGHAGYALSGSDIVCAAASVLITTCANALESVAGIVPLVRERREPVTLSVDLPAHLADQCEHDARVILQTTLQGFSDIAAQYPKYFQINDGRTSSC